MDIVLLSTLICTCLYQERLCSSNDIRWIILPLCQRLDTHFVMYFLFSGGRHEDWCKGNEKGLQGRQT